MLRGRGGKFNGDEPGRQGISILCRSGICVLGGAGEKIKSKKEAEN